VAKDRLEYNDSLLGCSLNEVDKVTRQEMREKADSSVHGNTQYEID